MENIDFFVENKVGAKIDINGSVSLKNYYKELGKIKTITEEEQNKLIKLAKEGNQQAINRIVEGNLRFVFQVAKGYAYTGIPLDDLISEGNIGLIKTIEKYDPNRGIKFISYAVWWIKQAIIAYIYENGDIVRLPINKINSNNKIQKEKEMINKMVGYSPFEYDVKSVNIKNEVYKPKTYNLEQFNMDCDNVSEYFIDEQYISKSEETINNIYLKKQINSVLNTLSGREKEIIEMYFGLDNKNELTLSDIGKKLKLTNERVRQIRDVALRKLRNFDKSSKLKEFV